MSCKLLRFCHSLTPVAAERPGTLTDIPFPFSFSYAHGRCALNGRTLTFTSPMMLACLSVRFSFPSHVTLTVPVCVMATCLDFPFVMLTFSCLCLLLILTGLHYAHMLPGRFVSCPCQFFLRPVLYPTSYPYPTGRYFRLVLLRLFVLVSLILVYILGWRWDDPHLQSTLQPP